MPGLQKSVGERVQVPDSEDEREGWLNKMLANLGGSDLLFFDPDNGIEVKSTGFGKKDSPKFIYWRELEETWRRGISLLVYQHFPREERDEYIRRRIKEMTSRLPNSSVVPLCTSNVLFLLAFLPVDGARFEKAIALIETTWSPRVWKHDSA